MKIIAIGILAVILFLLQSKIYEKLWNKNLKVSVSFAQKGISEGEKGEVIEVVENRKYLPLTMLKVKFQTSRHLEFADDQGSRTTDQYYRNDIFQIGGGEKITRTLTFTGKKRGYYHIKNIDLVGTDLFMSCETMESRKTECYLYVYPGLFDSKQFQLSLQKLNGDVLVKRHLLEDPFEYRGIREYQPYDDIRSVNWKATARTGALKVNQKNYTAMQTIRIFINIDDNGVWKRYDEVEGCFRIAMGMAVFFLSQGIKVACYTNGRDIMTGEAVQVPGGAGAGQQEVIGKALARVDTEKDSRLFVPLFEEKVIKEAEGTITIFVSPNGYQDYLKLLEKCDREGIEYRWFYPHTTSAEPEVPADVRQYVQYVHIER